MILSIVILLLAVVVIAASVKVVPQSETKVIERLGRFHSVLKPGLNIIFPFIDRPKMIYRREEVGAGEHKYAKMTTTSSIDLREQVYDFPSQQVITRDNVTTEINALLYFQIVDPKKSVYQIDNLPNAIEKLTQTSLRNVIGELELDETLTSRDTINTKLQTILDDATNKWGVKVNLNAEGEKQPAILRSEGEKQSAINRAEASRQAEILRAEGEAKARILQAEAEAEAIRNVSEAVRQTATDPATYLLATKYIETLQTMTAGNDTRTVFMPFEASSVLASIGSIRSLFPTPPLKY